MAFVRSDFLCNPYFGTIYSKSERPDQFAVYIGILVFVGWRELTFSLDIFQAPAFKKEFHLSKKIVKSGVEARLD